MDKFKLYLKSKNGKNDISSELDTFYSDMGIESVLLSDDVLYVFADMIYSEILLELPDNESISKVELFLNDDSLGNGSLSNKNLISFSANLIEKSVGRNGQLFADCYGFVQFNLRIDFKEGNSLRLYSKYLAVYFKDNEENRSLQKMAEFIYENYEQYLYDEKLKPDNLAGLKECEDFKNFDAYIRQLKKIVITYDNCIAYFKANPRFKITEIGRVDSFEKLTSISNDTLNYIAQHPEELIPFNGYVGIKYNRKFYQPRKTLVKNNVLNYDILENRAIIGFLKYLNVEIDVFLDKIRLLKEKINKHKKNVTGYISSIVFIFGGTLNKIQKFEDELQIIRDNVLRLNLVYDELFKISCDAINCVPEPTAVFMAVPQYNLIYNCIVLWFNFGKYDLKKEEFVLPFLVNHMLYEYYVLLKILIFFKDYKGFNLLSAYKYSYNVGGAKYKNTNYNNTFIFIAENVELTLYYQPVVFGQKYSVSNSNEIELFRNSSIRIAQDYEEEPYSSSRNAYYSPDYIIKLNFGGFSKYVILDAKYMTVDNVKLYQFSNLVFKYLYSISTFKQNDILAGMCIICGKSDIGIKACVSKDIMEGMGIKQRMPYSDILILNERIEDSNQLCDIAFDEIFSKYI